MVIMSAIGILVAAILIILIFDVGDNLLAGTKDTSKNSLNNIINSINTLNNNDQTNKLITLSENNILIGFKTDQEFLSIDGTCGDFKITRINKPISLKDESCLCLCDSKLLETDPSSCDVTDCVKIDYEPEGDSCSYVLLEGNNNIKIKKIDNKIFITK